MVTTVIVVLVLAAVAYFGYKFLTEKEEPVNPEQPVDPEQPGNPDVQEPDRP